MMRKWIAGLALVLGAPVLCASPTAGQEVNERSGNWLTARCHTCAWDLFYLPAGTEQTQIRMTCVDEDALLEVRHPEFAPDRFLRGGRLEVDGRVVDLEYAGGTPSLGVYGRLAGRAEGRMFMNAIRQRRPAAIVIQLRYGGTYRFEIPANEDLAPVEAFYKRCGW